MNNEIGRKITSLTLMTIMLAGGMVIAAPSMMPAAYAANANLFVSAENSQFDNYMSGPQVIEVVIIDSDINDTDQSKGEPDVTINGKIMRMVQAVDGNWYGYFADRNQALIADSTSGDVGNGLEFGYFCGSDTTITDGGVGNTPVSFSDTVGIAFPEVALIGAGATPGIQGATQVAADFTVTPIPVATCGITASQANGADDMNVVRESKDPVSPAGSLTALGQIGIDDALWPFIQLYPLNPTGNVVVQYNKGGGVQTATLTFDTVEGFASSDLDRSVYPLGSEIHATITDLWLNIDPTDEDSWTWNTADGTAYYQLFNENGARVGDSDVQIIANPAIVALTPSDKSALMCEDNCTLLVNANQQNAANPVLTIKDNDDTGILSGANPNSAAAVRTGDTVSNGALIPGTQPVTLTEQGPNSGVFGTYDESDSSTLAITTNAARGTSATIDYNETPVTILTGFAFATVDIQPVDDEWSSGEEIPVVITDNDANKNSRADEDLDLNNVDVTIIPSLSTGDPFTLGEGTTTPLVAYVNTVAGVTGTAVVINEATAAVDKFSERAIISTSTSTNVNSLVIDYGTNAADLQNTIGNIGGSTFNGFNLLNLDVRGFETGTVNVYLINQPTGTPILVQNPLALDDIITNTAGQVTLVASGFSNQGIVSIDATSATLTFTDALADNQLAVVGPTILGVGELAVANNGGANFQAGAVAITQVGSTTNAIATFVDTNTNGVIDAGDTLAITTAGTGFQNGAVTVTQSAISNALFGLTSTDNVGLIIETTAVAAAPPGQAAIAVDFFSFGFNDSGDAASDRIANQIIRIEAEETGDNSGIFEGSLEFIMVNQLNILDESTYTGLSTIADDPGFIVIEDLTDEDSPRVNYNDLGADGVVTQVADQEEAPSHSGIVSFDLDTYKVADTVMITLEDLDLNVDSDLIEIYTTVTNPRDASFDAIGESGLLTGLSFGNLGRLLDVTFDDIAWQSPQDISGSVIDCQSDLANAFNTGLGNTGFTLIETDKDSGKFLGDFQIPDRWCRDGTANTTADDTESTTGLDLEVNYVDFRDSSGEIIEVGDSAGIRANTGSISLDRTVYPVPFGVPSDFGSPTGNSPDNRSIFAIHSTGISGANTISTPDSFIQAGDLSIHIRVNDPDFDTSASGEDTINQNTAANPVGPVKVSVIRGSDVVVLGYAGSAEVEGVIDVGDNAVKDTATGTLFFNDIVADGVRDANGVDNILGNVDDEQLIRQFGPMGEIAPDAGIFEIDVALRYTDGPADSICSQSGKTTTDFTPINGAIDVVANPVTDRFDIAGSSGNAYCILQGDILQVEYTDPTDASGDINTITDSATFDLRNGVLQSDKSVYIIGSDMILTLIEPDLDLDNDQAETYPLDLIEWDSDAATITMGTRAGTDAASFDPEPSDFRETGDSTGIFQIVIEIPEVLSGDRLERGEEIVLEYTDWGPSGSDFVGDEDEDVNVTLFTSNFGATVELDQKVYSWTDKVYVTIVAPDHNFDGDLVDEIGNTDLDPIKISTRGFDIDNYKLVETGTDTGIFTGEVILTGFTHDADGDGTNDTNPRTSGSGPTDGFLQTDDDDGLTVSFEFSEDETVVGSSLIRWNIGEVQWLEASYPASGTGVVRVIDPDMNLDPEAVDNYDVDVWSDSDAGGIDLTVTETNEATGIFEGTVFFTTTDESAGHRLRVAEGDTVTAEYEDNTLPDPYTTADELDITATTLIGTVVPPLERAPAANLRTVDAFGNSLDTVSVDQQVQISADLANGQDREQSFAYLVQIQDGNGVTVSLAWITGSLSSGQSFSPALSWIPTEAGTYTATAFVWESVDNPTALSPPVSTTVNVR